MREAFAYLTAARAVFDDRRYGLEGHARSAATGGFSSGAEWMRAAMGVVRGRAAPEGRANFRRLGRLKYGIAGLGAAVTAIVIFPFSKVLAAVDFLLVFYAIESRFVFAFPLALDETPLPFLASRELVARSTDPVRAMLVTMTIAFTMIFGGLFGRGFLRSWAIGALAVLFWYERARGAGDER